MHKSASKVVVETIDFIVLSRQIGTKTKSMRKDIYLQKIVLHGKITTQQSYVQQYYYFFF